MTRITAAYLAAKPVPAKAAPKKEKKGGTKRKPGTRKKDSKGGRKKAGS